VHLRLACPGTTSNSMLLLLLLQLQLHEVQGCGAWKKMR
jgi:hypothetical protein